MHRSPEQRSSSQWRSHRQLSVRGDYAKALRYRLGIASAAFAAAVAVGSSSAQLLPNRIQGPTAGDIIAPTLSGKPIGYQDPGAAAVIAAYQAALGSGQWAGMQATGTVTFADDQTVVPATFSVLPGNRQQLDITESKGHRIETLNGLRGQLQVSSGKKTLLSATDAVVGIAPFDVSLVALATATPPKYSLIDDGAVSVAGTTLHKVTVEVAIPPKLLLPGTSLTRGLIDCYFDPNTHLLVKTAAIITAPGNSRALLLRVITYSNYQSFGAMQLPTTLSESISGQAISTLTLTSVDLANLPSPNTFRF